MSGAVNIEVLRGHDEGARPYKWDIEFSGPGLGGAGLLQARCSSADVPQPNGSPVDVLIRGFTKKEAGATEWNELSFTVIEVSSYALLKQLLGWSTKQFHPRSGVQRKKAGGYEVNATMLLLDGMDSPNLVWKIYGGILSSLTPPQFTSEKSGNVEITFSMAYDFAEQV